MKMFAKTHTILGVFICIALSLVSLSYQEDATETGLATKANNMDQGNSVSSQPHEVEESTPETRELSNEDDEHEHNEEEEEAATDPAKELLILKDGDAFSVLNTDERTGCLLLTEDQIPASLNGVQSYEQDCNPSAKATGPPSEKCRLYVNSSGPGKSCLKPTHLICDETTKLCKCGNEGIVIAEARFQFGTENGMNHTEGRCFIRPTFDYLHGFECSPGTIRKEIAVEEEADAVPICACEMESDFDKFDTSNKDWWKCSTASTMKKLGWITSLPGLCYLWIIH